MQVFKTFFRIAKKKLPGTAIYFVIFLVIMLLQSQLSNKDVDTSFQSSSLDICVIDEDHSDASKALTDYLGSIHTLTTLRDTDAETLQDNLFYQRISYVLTIPKGFESNLTSGNTKNIVDSSKRKNSASGYFVDQQIDVYLNSLNLYLSGGYSLEDAIALTDASISDLEEVEMVSFDAKSNTDTNSTLFSFFQYIPYVLILILFMGLTPILVTFRKKDIQNRIDCSSISLMSKNMQLTLGCALFSLFVWGIFMIAGLCTYGAKQFFNEYSLYCILNSFVFLCVSLALALFISTFSLSENALNMVANVVALGMSFLCGVFVPQWFLGESVLTAARFFPAYWYVRIINMFSGATGEMVSMTTYWRFLGIQFIFAIAIFALYLLSDKIKKNKLIA